jgi:putative ABC transport system ATP-binding protein
MLPKVDNVIEVSGLCKRVPDALGELTILDNIDFTVAHGQSIAITGASNCWGSLSLS